MTREEAQPAWERIVEIGFSDYEKLTRDQRIWFNIEQLTTGGIQDIYVNFGAEHIIETIEDLEFLGFHDIALLAREINGLFPDGIPAKDIDERNELMGEWSQEMSDQFDDIGRRFWLRSKELDQRLLNHIIETEIGKK